MKKRIAGTILVVSALVAAGAAVTVWARRRAAPGPVARPPAQVWLEDRPRTGILPGDPETGRALYQVHCASCHGTGGAGDGPAAESLWPRPRNHTDASYMNARSDQDLYDSIRGGGPEVGRSKLMPRWDDRFDSFQIWALVAYVRSLAPAPPAAAQIRDIEVVLADSRLAKAGGGTRRAPVYVLEDAEAHVTGYATYPTADLPGGVRAGLTLAFAADGHLVAAESHRRIRTRGVRAETIDTWLAGLGKGPLANAPEIESVLRPILELADARLRESLGQIDDDVAAAEAILKSPPADHGTALFLEACARCHGATGRVLGPNVVKGPFRPRNFADGEHMNALSDEYLRVVIAQGGLHWNLSSSMPSFEKLSADDVDLLMEHVRSLAVPRPDRACPCSSRAGACSMVDVVGQCKCRGMHLTLAKCPHEKAGR